MSDSGSMILDHLRAQHAMIPSLRVMTHEAEEFQVWERDTRVWIERAFGKDSPEVAEFKKIHFFSWAATSNKATNAEWDYRSFMTGLTEATALLTSMIRQLESAPVTAAPKEQAIDHIERLCERFHALARQLGRRHGERPSFSITDEYDLQDLFHALLRVFFDDIRTEEWTPSYAGKSSRMDFLLKPQRLVIETKKTREGLGAKEVGDQLIIDIRRYAEHPDCDCLVCFVYDPENRIANPAGVEADLSKNDNRPRVRVVISPQ